MYIVYHRDLFTFENREAKVKTASPRCSIILKCLVVAATVRLSLCVCTLLLSNRAPPPSLLFDSTRIIRPSGLYTAEAYKKYHVPPFWRKSLDPKELVI